MTENKQKPVIKYDPELFAWTDGEHFTVGRVIRKYAIYVGLRGEPRGRLSREEVARYFQDHWGVDGDVA